jgi:hypothetical protein
MIVEQRWAKEMNDNLHMIKKIRNAQLIHKTCSIQGSTIYHLINWLKYLKEHQILAKVQNEGLMRI